MVRFGSVRFGWCADEVGIMSSTANGRIINANPDKEIKGKIRIKKGSRDGWGGTT